MHGMGVVFTKRYADIHNLTFCSVFVFEKQNGVILSGSGVDDCFFQLQFCSHFSELVCAGSSFT